MSVIDPDMIIKVQVDTGAIKFILGGADVMCPGLTSAGGNLPDGLAEGTPVVNHRMARSFPVNFCCRQLWLKGRNRRWQLAS